MSKLLIGLVGQLGSGKGAVAEILKEKGFTYFSLADRVREEAMTRGLTHTRETLQNVGDDLRKKIGGAVLAERTTQLTETVVGNIVIDSIRNPAEIIFLKETFPNILIIGITAEKNKRFLRLLEEGRDQDPKTWEEFERADARDLGENQEAHGQHVGECLRRADVTIPNEGNLEELRQTVEGLLVKLSKEGAPPRKEILY